MRLLTVTNASVCRLLLLATIVTGTTEISSQIEGRLGATSNSLSKQEPVAVSLQKCDDADVALSSWTVPEHLQLGGDDVRPGNFKISNPLFQFKIVVGQPVCDTKFSVIVPIEREDNDSSIIVRFHPDGFLTYGQPFDEASYPPENYCISSANETVLTVKLCASECYGRRSRDPICIPKCCSFGKSYQIVETGTRCVAVDHQWLPNIFASRRSSAALADVQPNIHRKSRATQGVCRQKSQRVAQFKYNSTDVRFLENGAVYARVAHTAKWKLEWESIGDEAFCIEGVWDPNDSDAFANVIVVRCDPAKSVEERQNSRQAESALLNAPKYIVLPLIYIPSMLIHLIVLVVYISLWNQQNAHGWSIVAFSLSEFLYYLALTVLQSVALYGSIVELDLRLCILFGVLAHFTYLSCFSWTVVIAGDMWRSLSSFSLAQDRKGTKKFMLYSCFGWGIPTIVVSIGCAMEWGSEELSDGAVVDPGYTNYCSIYESYAFLFYMGLPSVMLFATVLTFAGLTFFSLWETKKKVRSVQSQKSKEESVKDTAVLIAKMGTLMGFFLIFEFILDFFDLLSVHPAFAVLEVYHLLQAVGLFWIYVCSKKTLKLLSRRHKILQRFLSRKDGSKTERSTEVVLTSV